MSCVDEDIVCCLDVGGCIVGYNYCIWKLCDVYNLQVVLFFVVYGIQVVFIIVVILVDNDWLLCSVCYEVCFKRLCGVCDIYKVCFCSRFEDCIFMAIDGKALDFIVDVVVKG